MQNKLVTHDRQVLKRSQIFFHPENPRHIDRPALNKLKEGIKRYGLVGGITVNQRTENNGFGGDDLGRLYIIGGHQRVRVMDELLEYDTATEANDYEIAADVIQVSYARELELIVLLNNWAIQGNWDIGKLEELLSTDGVQIKSTGFTIDELRLLDFTPEFLEAVCQPIGKQAKKDSELVAMMAEIRDVSKQYQQETFGDLKQKTGQSINLDEPTDSDMFDEDPEFDEGEIESDETSHGNMVDISRRDAILPTEPNDQVTEPDAVEPVAEMTEEEKKEEWRRKRREWAEKTQAIQVDYTVTIVFENDDAKATFLRDLGLPIDKKMFSGQEMSDVIFIE